MNGFHKEVVILAFYSDRNKKKKYSVFRNIEEARKVCPNGIYRQVPFYVKDELITMSIEEYAEACDMR